MKRIYLVTTMAILIAFILGFYFGKEFFNKSVNAEVIVDEPTKECPASCDDRKICTKDICSADTNYECMNILISPCCDNSICEDRENSMSCPLDCNKIEGGINNNTLNKNDITHNYTYQDINQSLEISSKLQNIGPLRVTLTKIREDVKGSLIQIRTYWEIYNMGEADIYINPHRNTMVLGNVLDTSYSKESHVYWKGYSSTPIFLGGNKEPDDIMFDEGVYFGNLKSGEKISGGVNVENIPINVTFYKKIKVRLSIQKFSDFNFDVQIESLEEKPLTIS